MEPIVYVDRSQIKPGMIEEVGAAIAELVAFVEAQERQLLSYGFYIDPEDSSVAVVAVHPDSESLARHLTLGGPLFRKVGAFIDLQSIDVYGEVPEDVREQLAEKAQMLGTSASVSIHHLARGFGRIHSA